MSNWWVLGRTYFTICLYYQKLYVYINIYTYVYFPETNMDTWKDGLQMADSGFEYEPFLVSIR